MRLMPLMLLVAFAALAGCKREPDFAERYRDVSTKISQSAHDIDTQIAGTETPDEEVEKP